VQGRLWRPAVPVREMTHLTNILEVIIKRTAHLPANWIPDVRLSPPISLYPHPLTREDPVRLDDHI
jgi:hypothetical protein